MPTRESLPVAHPTFSTTASLRHLVSLTRLQFKETMKNVFFVVLMLAGFLFAVITRLVINNPMATRIYPVTYQMLEMASAGFFIFAVAIIIFYSGELVWRERDARLNQVIDAFPVPAMGAVRLQAARVDAGTGHRGAADPGVRPDGADRRRASTTSSLACISASSSSTA